LIGSFFQFISRQLEKLSGLSDQSNDSYINSLVVCKKFYQDKDQNKTQQNIFSRYGDIAQVNDNTFVDCGRSVMNMQQFHITHSPLLQPVDPEGKPAGHLIRDDRQQSAQSSTSHSTDAPDTSKTEHSS